MTRTIVGSRTYDPIVDPRNERYDVQNSRLLHCSYASVRRVKGGLLERRIVKMVYTASDKETGDDIVIKECDMEHQPTKQNYQYETNCAAMLKGSDHGGVIIPANWYLSEDKGFIVSPKVGNMDLAARLEDHSFPKLTINEVVEILDGSLLGLNVLHRNGIIHRDIKPGNVLVGISGLVTGFSGLIDLDIASTRDTYREERDPTKRLIYLGTPEYISPEVAQLEEPRPETDIYSLGIVGFEMVTGRKPFLGTETDVVQKNVFQPLPEEQLKRAGVSDEFIRVIKRATEKNPEKRYHSAEEMRAELQRIETK